MSESVFSLFPNEAYVDLTLYQYGRRACKPSGQSGPDADCHYRFHYILSGKGVFHSSDSKGEALSFSLRKGDGFLTFPGQLTAWDADAKEPWEYVWIEFDGLRAEEYTSLYGFSLDRPVFIPKNMEAGKAVKEELLAIIVSSDASAVYLIGHLYLFMDALIKSAPAPVMKKNGSLRDFHIREALSFIEQNYQSHITLDDMAAHCHLERNYFGKLFKDALSLTPTEFLAVYRLTRAADLLKTSELSIDEISTRVGYSDFNALSRAFKNRYGITPRAYRFGKTPTKSIENVKW